MEELKKFDYFGILLGKILLFETQIPFFGL